jgi:hypothetical protein
MNDFEVRKILYLIKDLFIYSIHHMVGVQLYQQQINKVEN